VHDLLRAAGHAVPAVSELIFAEASAGLRPGTSDNGPVLGMTGAADGDGGLIIAAGHYRNGILLSAVTADAVAAIINGQPAHSAWTPFTPGRFRPRTGRVPAAGLSLPNAARQAAAIAGDAVAHGLPGISGGGGPVNALWCPEIKAGC
jgi:FAD dependent oxidoreductase